MHIAYVTQVDLTGTSGQNLYSRAVATALSDHDNVKTTIICPSPSDESIDVFNQSDINVRHIPSKTPGSLLWHGRIQFSTARELIQLHSREPLDGIVTPLKSSNIIPPTFATMWNVPMVLLVEGMLVKNIVDKSPFPGSSILANLISFLNAASSTHVFTAYGEAQTWIATYPGVAPDSVTIFHHGVDTDIFAPMSKMHARNTLFDESHDYDLVVGFVGSFKKYHKVNLLVRAARRLNENGVDIKLLLVGDGPEKRSIEHMVSDLNMMDNTAFTGFVKQKKVSRYIGACDVLYGVVDPEHWGHPMKIYEYLSCGRPVISYESPELEFIKKNNFGVTLGTVSEEAVEDALNEILTYSEEKKEKIGRAARRYIIENHTWSAYADAIVKQIDS